MVEVQFHNNSAKISGGAMYFTGIDSDTESIEDDLNLGSMNFNAGLYGGSGMCYLSRGYSSQREN